MKTSSTTVNSISIKKKELPLWSWNTANLLISDQNFPKDQSLEGHSPKPKFSQSQHKSLQC